MTFILIYAKEKITEKWMNQIKIMMWKQDCYSVVYLTLFDWLLGTASHDWIKLLSLIKLESHHDAQ